MAKIYSELAEQGFITEDIKETLMTQINGATKVSSKYAREAAYSNASLAAMQLMIAAKAMDMIHAQWVVLVKKRTSKNSM